jgi:hypothetical protein
MVSFAEGQDMRRARMNGLAGCERQMCPLGIHNRS